MTRTDAEGELNQFTTGFKRVYRYIQEFIPDHFITIIKDNDEYRIIENESTTTINDFNKDLFINLLIKEELKFNENGRWYSSARDLRTDGCDMGCWATSNPNIHSRDCRKSKNWGAGHE